MSVWAMFFSEILNKHGQLIPRAVLSQDLLLGEEHVCDSLHKEIKYLFYTWKKKKMHLAFI